MKTILLVGVGNELRADDGLGIKFVEDFKYDQIEKIVINYPDFDLIDKIVKFDMVIFVDASLDVECFSFEKMESVEKLSSFSHHISLKNIFSLAKYYNSNLEGYILKIRGYDFSWKNELSPECIKNMNKAIEFLKNFIDRKIKL